MQPIRNYTEHPCLQFDPTAFLYKFKGSFFIGNEQELVEIVPFRLGLRNLGDPFVEYCLLHYYRPSNYDDSSTFAMSIAAAKKLYRAASHLVIDTDLYSHRKFKQVNTLIYDIEIANAIPHPDLPPNIQTCRGWTDFEGMGISVIGWQWCNDPPDYSLYIGGFADTLGFYDDDDYLLVGFNTKQFDDKLLAANGLNISTHYDLLEEVRIAAGFSAHFSSVPRGYSYKLDAIARANGLAKTGTGDTAPVLWQQGKRQAVIDYCINDVVITKKLLDLGLNGELIDPNTKQKLQLSLDFD